MKNFDGKMVALADYRDARGVILIFDCNTCPYSKAYNDRIIALSKMYAPKGFPVITINPNDSEQSPGDSFYEMVSRARKKNMISLTFSIRRQVARAFGATDTPHVFLLKRKGDAFIVAYIGAIDNNPGNGSLQIKDMLKMP